MLSIRHNPSFRLAPGALAIGKRFLEEKVLTFTSTLNDGRGILPAATMLCGKRDLENCLVGGDVLYVEALRGSFVLQEMACWCWL